MPQTSADYGVLIPVPSEPTLDSEPVSAADLNALDLATAPVVSNATHDGGGSGCGCIGAGSMAGGDKGSDTPNRGVVASTAVTIGPVVAVSLTGDSPDAVRAWLNSNGFSLPQTDAATLDRYVGDGKYFIAIRRNEGVATVPPPGAGAPSSVGIHYSLAGDHRMLSLAFTRIGAGSKLAFTLFLAAPKTVGPSEPFKALTLNDLDAATLERDDYALAVETAVAARDSKAFVLESSTSMGDIAASVPGLARLADPGALITRATTVIAREQLNDDAVFATPFAGTVPSHRTVSLDAARVRYAGLGSLGLLVMAGALRRRPRERQPSGGNEQRRPAR